MVRIAGKAVLKHAAALVQPQAQDLPRNTVQVSVVSLDQHMCVDIFVLSLGCMVSICEATGSQPQGLRTQETNRLV